MSQMLLVHAGRVAERRGWTDPVLCDLTGPWQLGAFWAHPCWR